MKEEKTKGHPGEEESIRLLFFRSGGELFTVGIASITEIVVDGRIVPVPLAPPQVVGVINHRGRIFTVVSFAALVGLPEEERAGTAILLHRSDMSVGVTAEAIEGIKWVPRKLLDAVTPPGDGREGHLLKGIIDFQGKLAGVVDTERLVGAIVRLPEGATDEPSAGSERREAYGS